MPRTVLLFYARRWVLTALESRTSPLRNLRLLGVCISAVYVKCGEWSLERCKRTTGLATWSENYKWYSSSPLDAVI